jgi:hypothetical protein
LKRVIKPKSYPTFAKRLRWATRPGRFGRETAFGVRLTGMTFLTRLGVATLAALAARCASPTAPSSIASPTDPIVAGAAPFPAPVSQTLTGTWFLGARNFMTLTQNGSAVTGMEVPFVVNTGGTITSSGRATISGSVDGDHVTLRMSNVFLIDSPGPAASCTRGDTFAGTITGNTLDGIYTPGTTTLTCAGVPPIALATLEGSITFTRQ